MARPKSAATTARYARIYQMSLDGVKVPDIAREMEMSKRDINRDLLRARQMFAIEPTQGAINEHQRLLWEVVESLRDRVLKQDVWAIDRYLKALEALERVGGYTYSERVKGKKDDDGSEVGRWLEEHVMGGETFTDDEDEILKNVVVEYDDVLPDDLGPDQQLDDEDAGMAPKKRKAAR